MAAANGYREVIRFLINAGANIDQQDDYGYTPLHLAAKFNHVRIKLTIVLLMVIVFRLNLCTYFLRVELVH